MTILVVVGSGTSTADVMTSPDGTTWTVRTASLDAAWESVAYSPELTLFAAINSAGSGNAIMTSPDGITWTTRTSTAATFIGIIWSKSLAIFIAINDDGNTRLTSSDGITWTSGSTGVSSKSPLFDLVWAPGLNRAVAVGGAGADSDEVIYSDNGTAWTAATSSAVKNWRWTAWSPALSLFCSVGSSGAVQTSPTGVTWTARTASESNDWRAVAWSPSLALFAAVAASGTNRVMTSTDGTTWTARSAASASTWRTLFWSPALVLFVATGDSAAVMTSPDGITWTSRTGITGTWEDIVSSENLEIISRSFGVIVG